MIFHLIIDNFTYYRHKHKYAIQNIKNKNVIFLIGSNNSGKSTMIHYFADTKMKIFENNYKIIYNNYNNVNKYLQEIYILNNYKSTNSLIPINFKLINEEEEYVVIDTPSIPYYRKPLINAAQQLNMIDIITNAKAVHFCMIICEKDITDNQRLCDVDRTLQLYFGDNINIKQISFVYNVRQIPEMLYEWSSHKNIDSNNLIAHLQSINKYQGKLHHHLQQCKQEDIIIINPTLHSNQQINFKQFINNINNKKLWINNNNKHKLVTTIMYNMHEQENNIDKQNLGIWCKLYWNDTKERIMNLLCIIKNNMTRNNYDWIGEMIYDITILCKELNLGNEIRSEIIQITNQMNLL